MTVRKPYPVEDAEAARVFYAQLTPDLEVGHLAAMWHVVGLGHLVSMDLDRLAGRHGVSSADLHLLGTLRVFGPEPMRATDLGLKLHLSNAVLSGRVAKLERRGLLIRKPSLADKRAFDLSLTPEGVALADAAVNEVSGTGRFAQIHRSLTEDDKASLARVLGLLHDTMDRHF